jgi:ribosomal-protein-alanine N-acetyltransferase
MPADLPALARLHGLSFAAAWTEPELADLIAAPGGLALVLDGTSQEGFLLARIGADEAEILTLAVDPAARRRGVARRLVEAAAETLRAKGATALFLEVAVDNAAARALYSGCGFAQAGLRRSYYARPGGAAVDALVLRRALDAG